MHTKPAYLVIYDDIVEKINQKVYSVGDLLPSEAELEKLFKVSRTPVRAALKQLENEEYIYRVQGKGSYVANRQPKGKWAAMTGFQQQYSKDWGKISAKTLECKKVVHPEYAKRYQLEEDTELIYLARMRYHNGTPVVFQEHYLPPILSLDMFKQNLTFLSVQQFLHETLGIEYSHSTEEIEAVLANEAITAAMNLPKKTPLIKSTRTSYLDPSKMIDINIFYVNTKMWKYSVNYQY